MEGEQLPAQPQQGEGLEQQQQGEEGEQHAQQQGMVHPSMLTYNAEESRFYCPFPGCTRSFAELWRLKVHYRAPPDIRGSGKERGHGTELMHCPKCGQTLKPGKHHVGCVAGKAPRQPSSKRKGSGGGDAAAAADGEGLEGLPSPKKSKKKGGSKAKGGPAAAAAAAAAEAAQLHEQQASSSNVHSLASLHGDWGLDMPPPDPNSLLMPLPPPALWPELAPPPPQPPLPPAYSNGHQPQPTTFAWTDPAGAPTTMPFPFLLPPPPAQHNGHASHLDPALAAWTHYQQQQQQQQQLNSPFPLDPPVLNPADLQLHPYAQQQQQQHQQHQQQPHPQQLPQHLHPSLTHAHAPHSSHTLTHRFPHHAHHSGNSLMPPPARAGASSHAHAQEGLQPAGSLASSLPSLGSLPSELHDTLAGVDAVESHNTGAGATLGVHGGVHAPHGGAQMWGPHGAESMPAMAAGGMGGSQAVGGGSMGSMDALVHGAPAPPQPPGAATASTSSAGHDMLQEVDGDLLRVPSPPPLPHDFHPGVPKPMFNFSQFQQRMPTQQMQTGGLAAQGLGDLETSELAELNVVYDCTDDGELMQLLFGIGGDVPSMATVHMHKGPSPPHLPFEEDDSGLFMKPKSMQNVPTHGSQLLPHRPSTPMPSQQPQHPQHPPLKREPSLTPQEQQQQQQQQQQLLQHSHALPATTMPPPPTTTATPHGLHAHLPQPQQPQLQHQHTDFLQHSQLQNHQHLQPWSQPPTPHHPQWLAPPQPPLPQMSSTQQQHTHLAAHHPYHPSPAQLYALPMQAQTQQQHMQQPHKQHQLQQQSQPQQSAGMPCTAATQLCSQAELVRQHRAPHTSPVLAGLGPFANDGGVEASDNLPMMPPSSGEGCELGA